MTSPALWSIAPVAAATGTAIWAARAPGAQLFGPTLRTLPPTSGKPRIALTFDDGPNPSVTPDLLDLLVRHNVRATFFVIGKFVRGCPEIVREIAARGHTLANHTDSHPHLTWLSPARIRTELRRCEESIGDALHSVNASPAKWLRPPFGARGPQLQPVVQAEKFSSVVMWSRLFWDWKPQPPARLMARLARARTGEILLLHDGDHCRLNGDRAHVVQALAHWLPRWRDTGLEFVTINNELEP